MKKDRFELIPMIDRKGIYGVFDNLEKKYVTSSSEKLCDILNELTDENKQLKQELDYIQDLITYHIEHQKTELGQKVLREIIRDYNAWLLGHKRRV